MIVADTNLIAHLLIETAETEVARACGSRDPVWIAPAIWRHEFINVLSLHVRTRGLPMQDALRALSAADDFIQTIPATGQDERIIQWAAAHKMASYDAEFVIAAEVAELRLVTADKALVSKCPRAVLPKDFAVGF